MNKVYFWQGILGHAPDIHRYSETINKLLRGEYKAAGLDLKKMAGCRIYSARVNDTHRLLFTTIKVGNKSCLLLLEVVLNHDYQKSRFLKPSVLKKFLALINEQLENYDIDESSFIETNDDIEIDSEKSSSEFSSTPAIHFNACFLEYSDDQNEIIVTKLPAIISGPPGSGKTSLALTLLEQAAHKQSQGLLPQDLPILYVTANPGLKEKVEGEWKSLPVSEIVPPNMVRFLTYTELLLEREPKLANTTWVDATYFQKWLEDYLKGKRKLKISHEFASNHKLLMEELRIFSGYVGGPKKFNLGKKQSAITDAAEKEWFLTMASEYFAHLEKTDRIQPDLYVPKVKKPPYAFIVTDESDDFSTQQLNVLTASVENRQIAFCIGSHQNLYDNQSRQPYLEQLLGVSAHKLTATYRCPLNGVHFANRIIAIKTNLTGGVSHKNEFAAIAETKGPDARLGMTRWMTSKSTKDIKTLQSRVSSTTFAIITEEKFKDEVSKLFPTTLIFTPEQIKGSEYHTILLYRILDENKVFELASKFFLTHNFQPGGFIHRPKDYNGDTRVNTAFNRLFVAATRAQDSLYIFQEKDNRKLELLINLLNEVIVENEEQPSLSTATEKNTLEDWAKEAKRQTIMGNHEHAKQIAIKYGISLTPLVLPDPKESKQDVKKELIVETPKETKKEHESATETPKPQETSSISKRKTKKPATSETSKLEQSKAGYIAELIKTGITEDRLLNLLKHKHCLSLLFDKIKNEPSLIEKLITKSTHLNCLVNVCKNNLDSIPKVSAEQLLVEVKSKKLIEILLEDTNASGKILLALLIKANTKLLNDPLLKDYSSRFKTAFVILKESQKTESKSETPARQIGANEIAKQIEAKELAEAICQNQPKKLEYFTHDTPVQTEQPSMPTLPLALTEFGDFIQTKCKNNKLSTDRFKIQFKAQVKKLRNKLDEQKTFIAAMQELAIFAIKTKNLHAFEEIIQLLITQGKKDTENYIDFVKNTQNGKTLMHLAAEDGEDDMVDILLESGLSSLESTDREGLRPDDSAYLGGHKDLGDYMDGHRRERNVPRHLQAIKEMKYSLSSSYPGFFHGNARNTPAISVSAPAVEEVTDTLKSTDSLESLSTLIRDSQIDDYDIISAKLERWKYDQSTLIDTLQELAVVAVQSRKISITYALVDYLQMFGQDCVNFKDEVQNGKTLMHFAAENGDKAMIDMLKEADAQMTILDHSGLSPAQYSYQKGHEAIGDYIEMIDGKEQVEILSTNLSGEKDLISHENQLVQKLNPRSF
ncbi:MAG: hypothetical protein ABI597_02740 [Gammaproteobacteria bacterium]